VRRHGSLSWHLMAMKMDLITLCTSRERQWLIGLTRLTVRCAEIPITPAVGIWGSSGRRGFSLLPDAAMKHSFNMKDRSRRVWEMSNQPRSVLGAIGPESLLVVIHNTRLDRNRQRIRECDSKVTNLQGTA